LTTINQIQRSQRKYVFFSAERAEKKRSYSVMAVKIIAGHRNNTIVNKMTVSPQGLVLFVFLPLKGKQIKG